MIKIINPKMLLLTCCAIGALTAANGAWAAIDNCAQVTATTEADKDSTPNDKASVADILAAYNNDPNDALPNAATDDEDCASVVVDIIYDFGDAPDTYVTELGADPIGTPKATGAARHEIVPWLRLGSELTGEELTGSPTAAADGDTPDEAAFNITPLRAGKTGVVFTASEVLNNSGADAYLACWIDYDGSGTFDSAEFGTTTQPIPAAATPAANVAVTMPNVPLDVMTAGNNDKPDGSSSTFVRCRLSNTQLQATSAVGAQADSTGISDGEVEDYKVGLEAQASFDLALVKRPKSVNGVAVADPAAPLNVHQGDTVTFEIAVINQSAEIDATNIAIVDYIPEGLTLSDAAWTAAGSTATRTLAGLAHAATATVEISFTVDADAALGSITNTAEITAFTAKDENDNPVTDKDSTPDATDADFVGPTVDDTTGDAKGNPGTDDEDDHDIAVITVAPQVDVSLSKTIMQADGITPLPKGEARRGDTLVYVLTASNAGPHTATGVAVKDVLPAGITYVGNNIATINDPAITGISYDQATGIWTVGDLLKATSRSLKITVKAD